MSLPEVPVRAVRFQDIPQFHKAKYEVDIPWNHLEGWLERHALDGQPLDMDPDFQRGHVWTPAQQTRYIEFCLRGGTSARNIYLNHPQWDAGGEGPFLLVDGKQRLSAVLGFLRGEVPAFGSTITEYEDRLPSLSSLSLMLRMHIAQLPTRADVLRWYLDLNRGGVVHTDEEIARVRKLLEEEVQRPTQW